MELTINVYWLAVLLGFVFLVGYGLAWQSGWRSGRGSAAEDYESLQHAADMARKQEQRPCVCGPYRPPNADGCSWPECVGRYTRATPQPKQ